MCASPSLRIMLWPIRRFIRPAGLVRGEHVDALLLREDVVAPGEHGRAELRHERDRRFLPHPGEIWIGIGPELWDVDLIMRGIGHGALDRPIAAIDHHDRSADIG